MVRGLPLNPPSFSHDAVICDWPSVCEALAGVSIQRCWMIFNFLTYSDIEMQPIICYDCTGWTPLLTARRFSRPFCSSRYLLAGPSFACPVLRLKWYVLCSFFFLLLLPTAPSPRSDDYKTLSRLDSNWCLRAAEISLLPRSLRTITHYKLFFDALVGIIF